MSNSLATLVFLKSCGNDIIKRHTENTIHVHVYVRMLHDICKYLRSRRNDYLPRICSIIPQFTLCRDTVLLLDVALLVERATAYTSFLVMIMSVRNGQRL